MVALNEIGIPVQKQNQFASRGINTVEDLVNYLPLKYYDCTRETGFLPPDQLSCVTVFVERVQTYRGKRTLVMAFCKEEKTGVKVCVQWFNQLWMAKKLAPVFKQMVFVAGKASYSEEYRSYTITSPEVFELSAVAARRMLPVYRKVNGMSVQYLTDSIRKAL